MQGETAEMVETVEMAEMVDMTETAEIDYYRFGWVLRDDHYRQISLCSSLLQPTCWPRVAS